MKRFYAFLAALLLCFGSLLLAPSAASATEDPVSVPWDGQQDGQNYYFDPDGRYALNSNCAGNLGAGCVFNVSYTRSLVVCEDWSGTTADPGCRSGSRLATVPPRRWSPFYDSDGFRVSSGDQGQITNCTVINGQPVACTYNGPREVKVGNAKNHWVQIIN